MSIINNTIIKTIPLLPRKIVKIIADQYVAGESIENSLKKTKQLNLKNYEVTVDLLGEHVSDPDEIKQVTNTYIELLKQINFLKLSSNISVKPTHIGLDIGIDIFKNNAYKLVEEAEKYNNFIRFDMENSNTTDSTIAVFKDIFKTHQNVGTVFQAYLKRTYNDLEKLMPHKINFRLCKGIYNEDASIAFKSYDDINNNYLKIVELAFKNENYIGIATHDLNLLEKIYNMIEKYNISSNNFEFQVLYGVPMKGWLKRHIQNNFKVRIYLPYGPQWYEYSIRRLKENPNIAKYVTKSIFSKRDY